MLTRGIIRSVWLLKAAPSAGAGAAVQVPTQRVLSLMVFDASLLQFQAGQPETLPHLDGQARVLLQLADPSRHGFLHTIISLPPIVSVVPSLSHRRMIPSAASLSWRGSQT